MNRSIKRLGIALLVLYGALFVQLNLVQVLRADDYNDNPANRRAITRDFSRPRGRILAADGMVLAESVPSTGQFEQQRTYPQGELFAHTTGFFSFTVGADGVEKAYTDELAGRVGVIGVDNLVERVLDDERTADVRLTLDPRVQAEARTQLGDRRGAVVALDPRDGALIAMWSFPSYDPNVIASNDTEAGGAAYDFLVAADGNPLLPRAYRDTYFPGSTFKVVTASAGVQSGAVTRDTPTFPVASQYVPPLTNTPIRNFGGDTCGGSLFAILRVSCNTAFAELGVNLGADVLVGGAEAFGFNDEPPLDLPTVADSTIAPPADFVQNTPVLAQTAIGQNAVRAAPLQMALVAAGIANNGRVMEPHVMAEIRDDEGEILRTYEPEVWKEAVSPDTAALIRDAMVEVARDGTATRLQIPGVTVAGKTGTAQIGNGQSHAWIIGFAPAEAPRVAVAVIVEGQEGASEQTGGRVAAPIAQAVLRAALDAR